MKDKLITALLESASVRVIAISSKNLVEKARKIHFCMPTATVALGRALSAASMMGSMLKNKNDKVSLIIDGAGPAGRILCTSNKKANVKGYITNPQSQVELKDETAFNVGALVGKNGFIRVIRDMGMKEPYTGLCELKSGEIADDLAQYYMQSEQQPSLVSLGVQINKNLSVKTAGGIIILPMPDCKNTIIDRLEQRIMLTTDISRQLEVYDIEDFLKALFEDMDLKIMSSYEPEYFCECSRDKIEQVLMTLDEKELKDMIEVDKKASVTCHFCKNEYKFNINDLKVIIDNKK